MVNCPVCGHEVDWVTRSQAAQILGVSEQRVGNWISDGRLPNAVKHKPMFGVQELWQIPIKSVMFFHNQRLRERGLLIYD